MRYCKANLQKQRIPCYYYIILLLLTFQHVKYLNAFQINYTYTKRIIRSNNRNQPIFKFHLHNDDELISENEDDTDLAILDDKNINFGHKVDLPQSTYTQLLSTSSISSIATALRQSYDDHFLDPRQPNANRFVWDPWYVNVGDRTKADDVEAGKEQEISCLTIDGEKEAVAKQIQYSLKRMQTSTFFTENEYANLIDSLTALGRTIGLTAITPPWISLYLEHDRQNFHTDSKQGQMAFVLSLCHEGDFEGGETMILQPQILDYWKGFDGSNGLELDSIVRFVPPTPLGRCIAFDPRIPHGVNPVRGTLDPRKGRVVVHGWFNEPEVCWFGPWCDDDDDNNNYYHSNEDGEHPSIQLANKILEDAFGPLLQTLGNGDIGRVMGYLAVRLEIDEDGDVLDVSAVCDTMQPDWDDYRGVIGYDESDRPVMEDAVSDVKLTIYET
mmetsp:Transcript_5220/g.5752  ORF Transcript_5220/g.5752 Transcript_5220/m.5752 type:complete len:442 (+) Transcript_5220:114-1439(+)